MAYNLPLRVNTGKTKYVEIGNEHIKIDCNSYDKVKPLRGDCKPYPHNVKLVNF